MSGKKKMGQAYLTTEELAERYVVSASTIRRLQRRGLIPFFQPGGPGSALRFPPDALERSTSSSPVPAAPSPPASLPGPKPKWTQS